MEPINYYIPCYEFTLAQIKNLETKPQGHQNTKESQD